MTIELNNLDFVFAPRSIAFVGATETIGKWGFIILNNILSGGYKGKVYPVNPGRDTVMGIKAYPSVRDIPDEVDLAVFTVPARHVVGAIEDCVAKSVKAGVVVSAGFKELGGDSAGLEREMVEKATAGGMTIVGPNGQGVCCPASKLYSWMPLFRPPGGQLGFVSQSGNILNMLIARALECGFGVSKGISSGNQAQLKMEDFYSYLAGDPSTEVIVSYIEGLEDGRRFFDRAREVTCSKPLVAVKGGRTSSGELAARSHTGAMAVSDDLFQSACRQAGITLARNIDEAGILASSFVNRPLPRGRRVGIVTGGGGLGVLAADACTDEGLEVVQLSKGTLAQIGNLLPDWWVPGNPIDLVAGLDFTVVVPILEILMKSGEVDSVMFIFIGSPRIGLDDSNEGGLNLAEVWEAAMAKLREYILDLHGLMHELSVPIFVAVRSNRSAGDELPKNPSYMNIYPTVESACSAASALSKYSEYRECTP